MAGKQVNFEVNVDASDGIRGLKDFGKAAEKAGKDAAKSLDETASAGDQARAAIAQMAATFDSELREAAAAADALAQALGPELTGTMDVQQVVVDLEKMGVSFEEIRLEADKFATTLKQVDSTRLKQLDDGLGNVRTKMDGVRSSSDQSRSVLANLAGNAAQDLGQLGGVVGSLGVGIGQLAEYAVDGNIALKDLAKVAGPMAALTAALVLVQGAQAKIAKQDAFDAEQVEAFRDAVEDVGPGLEAIEQRFEDISDAMPDEENVGPLDQALRIVTTIAEDLGAKLTPFESLGTEITNMAAVLGELGFTYKDVSRLIAGGSDELDRFEQQLEQTAAAEGLTEDIMKFLRAQQEAYAESIGVTVEQLEDQAGIQRTLADEGAFYASTLEDINAALGKQALETSNTALAWEALLGFMLRGETDAEGFRNTWNLLKDEMNITDDVEFAAEATGRLEDKVRSAADAIAEAAGASEDSADSHQEAADALNEEADAAERASEALSAQADAQRSAVDSYYRLREARQDQVDAIHAVAEAEAEHGKDSVEYTEALEGVVDAVDETAQAQVQYAKEQAASEGATFSAVAAQEVLNETLIKQASQLTGDSRRAVLQHTAALNGIPPEVISEIETLLDEGKVQEATDRINELSEPRELQVNAILNAIAAATMRADADALVKGGRELPVKATLEQEPLWNSKLKAYTKTEDKVIRVVLHGNPLAPKTGGGPIGVQQQSLAAGPAAMTTAAPAAAVAPMSVSPVTMIAPTPAAPTVVVEPKITVQAGVIGDRFQVARLVARAMKQSYRLNGRRAS